MKNLSTSVICALLAFFLSNCSKVGPRIPNALGGKEAAKNETEEVLGQVNPTTSSTQNGSIEIASNDEAKPTRPTEDGEGLPGYLVDPSLITLQTDGSKVEIFAPPGTIKGKNSPDTLMFQVLLINSANAGNVIKNSDSEYVITDTDRHEDIYPLADGSFQEDFEYPGEVVIVLRLNQDRDDPNIYVTNEIKYTTTAFRDLSVAEAQVQPLTTEFLRNNYPDALTLKK